MPDYKILLVEDDVDAAEMIAKNLHLKKMKNVTHVIDSDGVFNAINQDDFDIILMDIQLPGGKNGIELTEEIKEITDIPVIFITANNITDEYEHLIRSNPYGFLSKPIKINDLVISIDICLERHKIYKNVQENETKLKLATQVLEILNQAERTHDVITDIIFLIKAFLKLDTVGLQFHKGSGAQYVIGKDDNFQVKQIDKIYSQLSSCKEFERTNTHGGSTIFRNIDSDHMYKSHDGNTEKLDLFFIPLMSDQLEIGTFLAVANQRPPVGDDTVRFLERISNSIGLTISRRNAASKMKKDLLRIKELEGTINKSPIVAFEISRVDGYTINKISESILNFNFSAEELLGQPLSAMLSKENFKEFIGETKKIGDYSKVYSTTLHILNNEQTYWADCFFWADNDDHNLLKGVFHDVSKRHLAEESLKNSQNFLEAILSQLEAAILIIDQTVRKIVDANEKAAEILELHVKELIGASCNKVLCNGSNISDRICNDMRNVVNVETKVKIADGRDKIVRKSVLELVYNGKPHHVVILFDITEQKKREQQLSHTRRLESIGQLAAGIAHEINTPSQYIGDNITFLTNAVGELNSFYKEMVALCPKTCDSSFGIQQLYEDKDIDYLLTEIPLALSQSKEGIERVSEIVSAMKKFSHPGTEEKSLLDINDALDNIIIVSRNQWKYFADIEKKYSPDIKPLLCYPADLNQALLNIIVNAAQAIEEKKQKSEFAGKITVETYDEDAFTVIVIRDNGIGMSPETIEKLFDPFFTTKDIGKGTGQGLSIVHTVIKEKHGGEIIIESELGEGSAFVLKIPKG